MNFSFPLTLDEPPAPDYFHPSERNDETDENSVIEMKDEKVKRGYSGLQDGEVLGFGEKTKDGQGEADITLSPEFPKSS